MLDFPPRNRIRLGCGAMRCYEKLQEVLELEPEPKPKPEPQFETGTGVNWNQEAVFFLISLRSLLKTVFISAKIAH